MRKVYLDYAAATPLDEKVAEAMRPYWSDKFYNPSALYLDARAVGQDVAEARGRVAEVLGARPAEIIFTAGGTEANNLAIHGVMGTYSGANMLVSAVEHESVRAPASQYNNQEATVNNQGMVDISDLEKRINDKTVLVSIMYANNEIGTIEPIKQIAQLIEKIRQRRKLKTQNSKLKTHPLYLHTDACQAANYLDLHVSRLGVDLLTINAGKIYGPKQSGALYVRAGVKLLPQIMGGGQEQNIRSGTENVPAIMGFAAALVLAQERRHKETKRLRDLQQLFFSLLADKLPQAQINGSFKQRLPNNVHITIPGNDNERVIMALDEAGIQCAAGSACSASSEEPSHVLKAIGLSAASAQSSLRFTMGKNTSESDIRHTTEALIKICS